MKTFKSAPSSSTIGTALICAGKKGKNQYISKKHIYNNILSGHISVILVHIFGNKGKGY